MRRSQFFILALYWTTFALGQGSSDVKISASSIDELSACYTIELLYRGSDASLASQNYRIFYNSNALSLLEEKSSLRLSEEWYSFNVVQHLEQLDASGVGTLAFENNLGFINVSVILNDIRHGGHNLMQDGPWTSIFELCFEKVDPDLSPKIILARKELTASYGRAFIELSQIDDSGVISSLPIDSYFDFNN